MTIEELQQQFEELKEHFKDHIHGGSDTKKVNYADLESSLATAQGHAYLSIDSASNGDVKVAFNTELFTTSGITWDSVNNQFVATVAGKYLVMAIVEWGAPTQGKRYGADIYKANAIAQRSNYQCYISSNNLSSVVMAILSLSVGDNVYIQARHTNGSTSETIVGGATYSFMSICKV